MWTQDCEQSADGSGSYSSGFGKIGRRIQLATCSRDMQFPERLEAELQQRTMLEGLGPDAIEVAEFARKLTEEAGYFFNAEMALWTARQARDFWSKG